MAMRAGPPSLGGKGREGEREERNGGLRVSPAAFRFRHALRSGVAELQGVSPRTFGNRPSPMFKNAFKNDDHGDILPLILISSFLGSYFPTHGVQMGFMCGGSHYILFK